MPLSFQNRFKTPLALFSFLVFIISCSSPQETKTNAKTPLKTTKKEIVEIKPELSIPKDTCSAKPSLKVISKLYVKEFQFEPSCNAEGMRIANHEFINDTLIIYSCCISVGDPNGFEHGSGITKYHWNCSERKLEKVDARIHIDVPGVLGGTPLSDYYQDDTTAIREREAFKRDMEFIYKARFIIGKEADLMYAKAYSFLKKDIKAATSHWKEIYGGSAWWTE
jgi:hypothetical protein